MAAVVKWTELREGDVLLGRGGFEGDERVWLAVRPSRPGDVALLSLITGKVEEWTPWSEGPEVEYMYEVVRAGA